MKRKVEIFGLAEWCADVMACELDVKQVKLSGCGKRGCVCDPCDHGGFRCNGGNGCQHACVPTACEDFNLVFCFGHCIRQSAMVSLTLIRDCIHGKDRITVTKDVESFIGSDFYVPIQPGDLAAGYWKALVSVKFSNGRTRQNASTFRVAECEDFVEEFEPCEPCGC